MWEELGILEYLLSAPVYSAEGNILREGRRGGPPVTINLAHYELEWEYRPLLYWEKAN